jgi:hypothetical protein
VGPRVGLDRRRKSLPHRDSIPGPSSPQVVAIPTTLPSPRCLRVLCNKCELVPGVMILIPTIMCHRTVGVGHPYALVSHSMIYSRPTLFVGLYISFTHRKSTCCDHCPAMQCNSFANLQPYLCNSTSHICAYAALGSYLHIASYRIWFSCIFTIFKTNYCPHGLVMSGKGEVCADE